MRCLRLFAMMLFILFGYTSQLFGQGPVVTSVTPISGSPGQTISISGENLSGVTSVAFGSVVAVPISQTSTLIQVAVPTHAPLVVPIILNAPPAVISTGFQFVIKGNWKVITANNLSSNLSSFPVTPTLPPIATPVADPNLFVKNPTRVAFHPDGTTAYAVNSLQGFNEVNVVDIASNTVINAVPLGLSAGQLQSVAVNSVGTFAYVTSQSDGQVYTLDIAGPRKQFPQVVGSFPSSTPSSVTSNPTDLAISSDDQALYVLNQETVSPPNFTTFDLGENAITPTPILSVPLDPGTYSFIGLTPRSAPPKAFISDSSRDRVLVYDVSNPFVPVVGPIIPLNGNPKGLAVNPLGTRLYVADNLGTGLIHVVSTEANALLFDIPVTAAVDLYDIVVTPDDTRLFVTDRTQNRVYSVPLPEGGVLPPPSFVEVPGLAPLGIAITPDQAPLAGFETIPSPAVVGQPITFSAVGLSDSPVGEIVSYCWDFDDESVPTPLCTASPTVTHTYTQPGTYAVTLTVTNSAGTSVAIVFPTGQELTNNGGPTAIATKSIVVQSATPPISSLVCPPRNVHGCQKKREHGRRNIITWKAPKKNCGEQLPSAYRIYLDSELTQLLAEIPADQDEKKFKFRDSIQGNDKKTYFIVSVDELGNQSLAVSVTIGKKDRCSWCHPPFHF